MKHTQTIDATDFWSWKKVEGEEGGEYELLTDNRYIANVYRNIGGNWSARVVSPSGDRLCPGPDQDATPITVTASNYENGGPYPISFDTMAEARHWALGAISNLMDRDQNELLARSLSRSRDLKSPVLLDGTTAWFTTQYGGRTFKVTVERGDGA